MGNIRCESRINTDRFPKRASKDEASIVLSGVGGMLPWKFFGFYLLKVPFPVLVVQTGYWPVPFSSDEALRIGGLFVKVNFHVVVDMEQGESCQSRL